MSKQSIQKNFSKQQQSKLSVKRLNDISFKEIRNTISSDVRDEIISISNTHEAIGQLYHQKNWKSLYKVMVCFQLQILDQYIRKQTNKILIEKKQFKRDNALLKIIDKTQEINRNILMYGSEKKLSSTLTKMNSIIECEDQQQIFLKQIVQELDRPKNNYTPILQKEEPEFYIIPRESIPQVNNVRYSKVNRLSVDHIKGKLKHSRPKSSPTKLRQRVSSDKGGLIRQLMNARSVKRSTMSKIFEADLLTSNKNKQIQ